jgi:hypothetical protein
MDLNRGQTVAARSARVRTFGDASLDALTPKTQAVSVRESLLACSFFFLLAGLLYGWYVGRGGFYSDDWGNASYYRFADPPRYFTSVAHYNAFLGGRPILAVLLPLPHALFGLHTVLHLALALVLNYATVLCFYALLRTLAFSRLDAGAIAALFLVFPWSDSIRLWSTASLNTAAVIFFLLGLILALRSLNQNAPARLAMRCATMLLYALSVLTYQACAAAALLAGFLYLRRTTPRRAVAHWLSDIAAVTGALAYSYVATLPARHVATISERLSAAPEMVREAFGLLALALVPFGSLGHRFEKPIVLFAGIIFLISVVQIARSHRRYRGYWMVRTTLAGVGIAAAYFMILTEGAPLSSGIGNRSNLFAALPYCVLVYGLVSIAAETMIPDRRAAASVALVGVVALFVGYTVRVHRDESAWVRAARLQQRLLTTVDRKFPDLPRHSKLLIFDYPAEVAPGVLIFARTWDLEGALQLQRNDHTLRADPVHEGIDIRCSKDHLQYRTDYSVLTLKYEKLYFLDAHTGRRATIANFASCQSALESFPRGPAIAPS